MAGWGGGGGGGGGEGLGAELAALVGVGAGVGGWFGAASVGGPAVSRVWTASFGWGGGRGCCCCGDAVGRSGGREGGGFVGGFFCFFRFALLFVFERGFGEELVAVGGGAGGAAAGWCAGGCVFGHGFCAGDFALSRLAEAVDAAVEGEAAVADVGGSAFVFALKGKGCERASGAGRSVCAGGFRGRLHCA